MTKNGAKLKRRLLAILLFIAAPLAAQAPGRYTYIVTATTTAVRSGQGALFNVTINGGTAGIVTLYDIGAAGCTGTPASGKFAIIEAIGATNPTTIIYNLRVDNGICVVTAAATDITVVWN